MDDEEPESELLQAGDAAKKKKPKKKKKKNKGEGPAEAEDGQDAECTGQPTLWQMQEDPGNGQLPPGHDKEWVDVTSLCDLAVQGMNVGEMIDSSHFRLYDAMSAIEIMDPKMDSGYNNSEDMTLEKAEAQGLLSQAAGHEELAGLIDQLLMYYLLWLDGHTVVQTIFCCLYLQDPARLLKSMPAFGAFVDAFLICCRRAHDAIVAAGVFDDEDFLPTMFSVNLEACAFSAVPAEVTKSLASECARLRKSSEAAAEAVAFRLEFIGDYMRALVSLSEIGTPAKPSGPAKAAPRGASAALEPLTNCLRLLERLELTVVPAGPEVLRCFDASINRKFLVPGPPRTVEPIKDPKAVFGMWTSHVHELTLCESLTGRQLNELLQGAVTYKEQPNILPRSFATRCLAEPGIVRRLVLESLEQHLFPAEALQHCKKPVDTFLTRCESMFLHMFKLAHSNNARRFRRLAHVFPDFNELQHEAWRLDETLKGTFGTDRKSVV